MSNTSVTNLLISDTFQIWINKTNEIIDLMNQNVMLAGSGGGFTVTGNSTLIGSFTANTLNSTNSVVSNTLTANSIQKSGDVDENIQIVSPVRILSSVQNIFELASTSGNRPALRMRNGGNATWSIGHLNTASSSGFGIGIDGASTPQLSISQAGRLSAVEFEGNGALITNINASNISSGTLNSSRIPNLDASKITTGTLGAARIPNLDASKITTGIFDDARIPGLEASKITSGIISNDRLPASATRGEILENSITNATSTTQGFITGRRFNAAFVAAVNSSSDVVRTSGSQDIAGIKTFTSYTFFANATGVDFTKGETKDRIRISPADVGGNNRIISITTPANGLTADRTLTLANGNTTLVAGTMVPTTRKIIPGVGIDISGNGDFVEDRTISIDTEVVASIGVNQTWQDVSANREHNTTYTNNTDKPIMVAFSGSGGSTTGVATPMFEVSSDGGANWIAVAFRSDASINHTSVIVPKNWNYRAVNTPNLNRWVELR
jgi:hypothetical protein